MYSLKETASLLEIPYLRFWRMVKLYKHVPKPTRRMAGSERRFYSKDDVEKIKAKIAELCNQEE